MADGVLALDAEELLHARVPGFHHADQIHGENADVQGFDDVFAEVLEARNFQRFLFERRVQLGVVQRDGEVAGDGLHQLDVVAGEKIAVDGFTQAEHRDGVLANTAGHEIVQVQLLERRPHSVRNVSRRAGRLKKERPTGELGPGRLEEAKIHGLGEAHAHGASEAHMAGAHGVFHEDGQAIDEQSLGNAVHDRAQHGVETHFIGEGAAEFNQGAPVVEPVAVEETIQARLNPFAKRLKQEGGNDDSDHAACRSAGLRVEDLGNQGDEREVHGGNGGGGRGVGQTALEDDVDVHQAVANDGVAEAQGNEHQAEHGKLHPGVLRRVQHKGDDVEEREGQTARQRSAGEPLQLLAKHAGRSFAKALVEHESGGHKEESQVAQFDFVQEQARAQPGDKAQHVEGGADVKEQQCRAGAINKRQFGKRTEPASSALRKDQREMQQQRRRQHARRDARPVHLVVKGVELAAVLERIEDEGDEAEHVEVHGARGVPSANENKHSDEQIEQAQKAAIVFYGSRLFRGGGDQRSLKFLAVADQFVT